MKKYPKISIVIPNLNGQEVIGECLESAEKVNYPNYDIIVVDNGSKDRSPELIRKDFPDVSLILNKVNLGAAEGYNQGIRYALKNGADYVFTTNNDVTMDRNILIELLNVMEDHEIGVSGPITYYDDDPDLIQFGAGRIHYLKGLVTTTWSEQIDPGNLQVEDSDYQGSVFISSHVLEEVGLFNSNYFAYWEDAEFCTRVKRADFKVVCVPSAKIWHKVSHTFKKMPKFGTYLLTKNTFWFLRTYATKKQYAIFLLCYFGFYSWVNIYFMIKARNMDTFFSFIRGIIDGLILKTPPTSLNYFEEKKSNIKYQKVS